MRYDVVFNGEFSPEHDINEAKQKLAKIFKLKPATVDKLFSGQSVTIRKNVDATTAEKYRKAAAGCGVIFKLDPAEASSEVPPAQVAAARNATMVICPACGCSQSRATTCLRCGEISNQARGNHLPTCPHRKGDRARIVGGKCCGRIPTSLEKSPYRTIAAGIVHRRDEYRHDRSLDHRLG